MDRFEEAKHAVKERVDLPDLVQEYIPLTRRGRLLVACCPFHAEKTPSFTVYADSQHYKCYGCGKAGDVFSFVMEREGVGFRDAMEQLAERASVSLDGVFSRGGAGARTKVDYAKILGRVRDFFAEVLRGPDGQAARDYLDARGLTAAIEPFGIGASPRRPGRLARFAREQGLPLSVLAEVGLVASSGREPLSGRVVFPIVDERGRVVGFGGRVLPGDETDQRPKYWNSPESPVFNKRRVLFGLRQAKQSGDRRIVVVEGYTDVIACHLAGISGAVATLGTALTADHARLLERYATGGVTLLFDGDRAGRQAADRAFRELVHTTLPVRIALLPEGRDPADLVGVGAGASGPRPLDAVLDRAEDALRMWFRLLRERLDFGVDANVQRAAEECARLLGDVESRARREALRAAMARELGLSEAALEPRRPRRARASAAAAAAAPGAETAQRKRDPVGETELDLVACLLADPTLRDEVDMDVPVSTPLAAILDGIRQAAEAGRRHPDRDAAARFLFTCCGNDEPARRFLAESLDRSRRIKDVRSIFSMLQAGRRQHFARQEARRTKRALQDALASGDEELADRLTRRYLEQVQHRTGSATSG